MAGGAARWISGEHMKQIMRLVGLGAALFTCDVAAACGWSTRTYDKTLLGIEVEAEIEMTAAEKVCGVVIQLSAPASIDTQPAHGTVRYRGPDFVYTATPGYVGADKFYASGVRGPDRVSITVYITIKK